MTAIVLAGCAQDPGVFTESARRPAADALPSTAPTAPPATDPAAPSTAPPTDPPATSPPPATTPAPTDPPAAITDVLDFGDAKQPRPYDDLVRAAVNDIQLWWSEQFPGLYGSAYEPIRGGVFAAYPERTTPIPGCGTAEPTSYEEIARYSAFYCAQGDFMVYDDGERGAIYHLAEQLGPSILTVVLAHEFGHVVQTRAGELDRGLPTIATEQQADCFAGAWVARVARGEANGISFTDADVRTGLSAMIAVRDPLGTNQLDEGGHGSAFDRVGAFQVGFVEGPTRCASLLDEPLPLVDNTNLQNRDGNAPYGYDEGQIVPLIVNDLNVFWPQLLSTVGVTMAPLEVVPVGDDGAVQCADPAATNGTGVVYCPSSQRVYFDESLALDLYGRYGDFVVGYLLGGAWSEAVQHALGSPLAGEERILAGDCLTGAWVADLIPTAEVREDRAVIESGDLDEAIQTALVLGDETAGDNVVGSGFEKIAAFREGVFGGFDACTERIGD